MNRASSKTLAVAGALLTVAMAIHVGAQQSPTIPDEHLYRAVFRRILAQEAFGDQIDAKGHSSANARAKFRRDAQLTDAEDAALKAIAKAFGAADEANRQRLAQLVASLKDPGGKANPAAVGPELKRLQEERSTMVLDSIAQLKARFGPSRFAALNGYVRSAIAPRVGYKKIEIK